VSCEPGHYYTGDLGAARLAFHTKGLCPEVKLNSRGLPKTLKMKTDACSIVVHKLGSDSSVCHLLSKEFEKETGVPLLWTGESLATLLFKAFETTMKPQKTRRQLTEEERQGLWEAQGSVCKLCGCTGTELEVDHVLPLCMGGADAEENLQILCKACHTEKPNLRH